MYAKKIRNYCIMYDNEFDEVYLFHCNLFFLFLNQRLTNNCNEKSINPHMYHSKYCFVFEINPKLLDLARNDVIQTLGQV